MYNQQPAGGGGYYPSQPGGPQPGWDQGGQQQQFPGQQFLQDPMANMAMQYGSNIADQGKEIVQQKVWFFLGILSLLYID